MGGKRHDTPHHELVLGPRSYSCENAGIFGSVIHADIFITPKV